MKYFIASYSNKLAYVGQSFLSRTGLRGKLRANFDPRGEVVHQGVKLSPGGEILCSPLHPSKQ
jgi:hypothetical protein